MPTDPAVTSRAERLRRAGEWLRGQRDRRGWTGRYLATLVGITPTQISNYERGRDGIDDERAEGIARALGLDVVDVRHAVGLWVPEGYEPGTPRMVTPEEAIRADPTLRPDQRETAIGMLALIRAQRDRPRAGDTQGGDTRTLDPDAPPGSPGYR